MEYLNQQDLDILGSQCMFHRKMEIHLEFFLQHMPGLQL